MQFVDDGPDVPEELLREHLAGNVVFVVGAGLSMPAGLPSFASLIDRIYQRLTLDSPGVPDSKAPFVEVEAFKRNEFDRVLGLLERRVVYSKPSRPNSINRVRDAATAILQSAGRDTAIQSDLLEISSDGTGRPRLLTTNFDLLFEKAWRTCRVEPLSSFSGTALPAVGSPGFTGVMHLHGRVEDPSLDLEASELVLTSGDFGEAYLRSGWASRYVYDLLRRYTLVFVGYSADDPPMRYMLEAAEAGRVRFPDVRRAYAFAPSDGADDGKVRERWRAKGLTPIIYSDHDGHAALAKTIEAWAQSCRDPISWATTQIAELTKGPFETAPERAKTKVAFLTETVVDIAVLAKHASSCEWIEPLLGTGTSSARARQRRGDPDIERLVVWMRGRLEDREAVAWALRGKSNLPPRLAAAVRWLLSSTDPKEPYRLFWRLYCDLHFGTEDSSTRLDLFKAKGLLEKGVVDYTVIKTVAEALRPHVSLSRPFREDVTKPVDELAHLARCTFKCPDHHAAKEALDAWPRDSVAQSRLIEALDRVLADVFEYLRQLDGPHSSGEDYVHLGLVHPFEDDETRTFNPDPHSRSSSWRENEPDYMDDSFAPIVRAMTASWRVLADLSSDDAERIAERWLIRTETTFRRMGVWAARDGDGRLFENAERILGSLDRKAFWLDGRNPEFARFWCKRWSDLKEETRINIQDRIIEGPATDWLIFAQGNEEEASRIRRLVVHRELTRIKTAGGSLSDRAKSELSVAETADALLPTRVAPVEGLYPISWSGSGYDGDVSAVQDVPAEKLLDRVAEIQEADPRNQSGLWNKLCFERPDDAWAALKASALAGKWDGRRWSTFVSDRIVAESGKDPNPALTKELLSYLVDMPEAPFELVAQGAASFIRTASERGAAEEMCAQLLPVWDRLRSLLDTSQVDHEPITGDPQTQALNRVSGCLTSTLKNLLNLQDNTKRGVGLPPDLSGRFTSLLDLADPMRTLALHMMSADLFFLHFVDPDWAMARVVSEIDQDGPTSTLLLDSWVRYGEVRDVQLFNRLRNRVEAALTDIATSTGKREHLARLITWASFMTICGDKDIEFTPTDARRILSRCSQSSLQSIAWSLNRSVSDTSAAAASDTWLTQIAPFFEQVWPIDVDTLSPEVSKNLFRIPQACGRSFKEAVDRISGLTVPSRLDSVMFDLDVHDKDDLFVAYPADLLRLAYEAIDPDQPAPYDLATFLTKIGDADASLKTTWHFRRLSALLRQV